ncbi:peroxynitrite isomerase [Mycobacterium celatum]|uniref:Peroxynitrite isomerase n=1 Tax=Mycobacterium celatum TaxID=28045 RepID=A0A1X1RJS6_MYCCE|nr:FABP family protein [Mycobacterium celatum]ORV07854.1 fatty acid-binding-like protein [Mycobacterium celatum]PIB74851.1 FABP family protein [Mycobacterium celatum]
MPPELHPDLEELAPLLGTWTGRGSGIYPTIEPFEYLEEVVFGHVGKPFLAYGQKTKSASDGKPLHAETGYLRVPQPGQLELVLAHPSGITEIEVGTYTRSGDVIEMALTASTIGLTPTAKEVSALGRRFRIDGDELSYSVQMGAVGQPLQDHLSAVLHRSG